MIHEYALDPELLKSWASNDRDYAEFFREYGIGTPRLISSYPKEKKSKLRNYFLREAPADQQSRQGLRYVEMVTQLLESVVLRCGLDCRSGIWSDDVRPENERAPFSAILSVDEIDTPNSLIPANMYLRDSIWNHPRQKDITRTLVGLNEVAEDFLRFSTREVVIVDAYGWTDRAIVAIKSLVEAASKSKIHDQMPEFYLYYKEKVDRSRAGNSSPSADFVKQQILSDFQERGAEVQLHVFELKEREENDVFHNRCILTEHGGVSLGHGVDVSNDVHHTDEAKLLEKHIYEKHWRQFMSDTCFDVVSQA